MKKVTIMNQQQLNGHQVDVLRRTIGALISEYGECHLVTLAQRLVRTGTPGFTPGYWCGYGKTRAMIGAYPQFFRLGLKGDDATIPCVRLTSASADGDRLNDYTFDNTFDIESFLMARLTPALCRELAATLDLSGSLRIPEVLRQYLLYTFRRLEREKKIVHKADAYVWHSGLFRREIDACIFYIAKNDATGEYRFNWAMRNAANGREIVTRIGNVELQKASFQYEAFDPKREIIVENGHIVQERHYRFPSEIIRFVRDTLPPVESLSLSDAEVVERHEGFFFRLVAGAIEEAKSRIGCGSISPVPYWNMRTDKICWLIPLRLGLDDEEHVALVLEPITIHRLPDDDGFQAYRAHTILSLRHAFFDARLLGEVTARWLDRALIFTNN